MKRFDKETTEKLDADVRADGKEKTRTRFYAAVAALTLSAVSLGLAFLPNYGVYFLIASIMIEISALSFLSSQKKINDFNGVKVVQIIAYVLLFLSSALFLGGFIYFLINSPQV